MISWYVERIIASVAYFSFGNTNVVFLLWVLLLLSLFWVIFFLSLNFWVLLFLIEDRVFFFEIKDHLFKFLFLDFLILDKMILIGFLISNFIKKKIKWIFGWMRWEKKSKVFVFFLVFTCDMSSFVSDLCQMPCHLFLSKLIMCHLRWLPMWKVNDSI